MRQLFPALLVLSACAVEGELAPDVSSGHTASLTQDKVLASPDEVAAVIRTRAVLDNGIDALTMLNFFGEDLPNADLAKACHSEVHVVWRETGCNGLHGWGFEYEVSHCPEAGIDGGTVFWSYPDVLAGLGAEVPEEDVVVQLESLAGPPRPDRVASFAAQLTGEAGGQLSVCGHVMGDQDQQQRTEIVEVDIGAHQARIVFDTDRTRVGDAPQVMEHVDGSATAQFPRGALVDPYRFDMGGFSKFTGARLPVEGEVHQRGWTGDLEARVTDAAATDETLYVDGARGPQFVAIPNF